MMSPSVGKLRRLNGPEQTECVRIRLNRKTQSIVPKQVLDDEILERAALGTAQRVRNVGPSVRKNGHHCLYLICVSLALIFILWSVGLRGLS